MNTCASVHSAWVTGAKALEDSYPFFASFFSLFAALFCVLSRANCLCRWVSRQKSRSGESGSQGMGGVRPPRAKKDARPEGRRYKGLRNWFVLGLEVLGRNSIHSNVNR